jgi:N-methylhydantoinase A
MVDETMANAARVHAVERGKDVAARTLIAFGGAAPIHAARLAEKLRIARVVVPTGAGVGSAVGFLRAPAAYEVVRSRYLRLADFDPTPINQLFEQLEREARRVVEAAAPDIPLRQSRVAHMRYVGQGHEIVATLPVRALRAEDRGLLQTTFDDAYRRLYGRLIPGLDVEVLSWGLSLQSETEAIQPARQPAAPGEPALGGLRDLFDSPTGGTVRVPVCWRRDLPPGATIAGPAVIAEEDTTILVSAAFRARVDERGYVWLERSDREDRP